MNIQNVNITRPGMPDYPQRLLQMENPPQFLTYAGEPVWMKSPLFAVVGSRRPAPESLSWIEEELPQVFARGLACSLSGGAFGVDQAVHRASIRTATPTVVVLPSGLNQIYPSALQGLVPSVLHCGGCLLSEYPLDQKMRKQHFARRNQIIAALALAVLVVDAKIQSGTMITARHAVDLGRPVFVMPTHPTDFRGRGGLRLLCEGASPVTNAEEVCTYIASEISSPSYI